MCELVFLCRTDSAPTQLGFYPGQQIYPDYIYIRFVFFFFPCLLSEDFNVVWRKPFWVRKANVFWFGGRAVWKPHGVTAHRVNWRSANMSPSFCHVYLCIEMLNPYHMLVLTHPSWSSLQVTKTASVGQLYSHRTFRMLGLALSWLANVHKCWWENKKLVQMDCISGWHFAPSSQCRKLPTLENVNLSDMISWRCQVTMHTCYVNFVRHPEKYVDSSNGRASYMG